MCLRRRVGGVGTIVFAVSVSVVRRRRCISLIVGRRECCQYWGRVLISVRREEKAFVAHDYCRDWRGDGVLEGNVLRYVNVEEICLYLARGTLHYGNREQV